MAVLVQRVTDSVHLIRDRSSSRYPRGSRSPAARCRAARGPRYFADLPLLLGDAGDDIVGDPVPGPEIAVAHDLCGCAGPGAARPGAIRGRAVAGDGVVVLAQETRPPPQAALGYHLGPSLPDRTHRRSR
jgi:hypothetical protein